MHFHYRHYLQHINTVVSKFQCMTWGWRRDSGLLQHKPVVPTYTILTGLYYRKCMYQISHTQHQFLSAYSWLHVSVTIAKHHKAFCKCWHCKNCILHSPFTLKMHYKCIILCIFTLKGEIPILMQYIIFPLPAFIKGLRKVRNYKWNIHLWFVNTMGMSHLKRSFIATKKASVIWGNVMKIRIRFSSHKINWTSLQHQYLRRDLVLTSTHKAKKSKLWGNILTWEITASVLLPYHW